MTNHIEKAWEAFSEIACDVDDDADGYKRQVIRASYFAGAAALWKIIGLDPPPADDVTMTADINRELKEAWEEAQAFLGARQ